MKLSVQTNSKAPVEVFMQLSVKQKAGVDKFGIGFEKVEDIIVGALVRQKGVEKFGMAPRGSLERKCQKLLDILEGKADADSDANDVD